MNEFQEPEPPPTGLLRVDETVGERQAEKLKKLRAERSNDAVSRALSAIREGAKRPEENLMPLILDAVKAEATLGEISDAMRDVFGEHKEIVVL